MDISSVHASQRSVTVRGGSGWLIGLGLLVLIGFWLRLSALLGSVYQFDEFISMLAAKMVTQRGLPILPSGLFYDSGLLFSFVSGAFIWLLGFREEIARWPVLLSSVLTIAIYYNVARRLFDARLTGLLAASLVTFDNFSIVWGQRARMYAFAHLFVLLSIAWLLEGTLKHPSQRSRYISLAFLIAALFSHTITFVIVPTLALLLLVFTLAYRREWLHHPRLWQEVVVTLVALALVLWVVSLGQIGSTVSLQDPNANAPAPLGIGFLRGFFVPGLELSRFSNFIEFFNDNSWLFAVIGLSLLAVLYRLLRRTASFADNAFLFLALFSVVDVLGPGILISSSWSIKRYLFLLMSPAFLLLGAESLARLLRWLGVLVSKLPASRLAEGFSRPGRSSAVLSLAGVLVVAVMWGPNAWRVAHAQGSGDYNTAFIFVREHWQPGDKVMTVHSPAAYLYLGRCDYYANQATAKVLPDSDSEAGDALVDRYTASPLIDSPEKFSAALAGGHRVWFVVDRERLFEQYTPLFVQQVFAQMDGVYQTGKVYVFASHAQPVPVPAEPKAALDGDFSHIIRLEGYSLDAAAVTPDRTAWLGLYWRPVGNLPHAKAKVFVQLRNGQGQTIAQADHFIYENALTGDEWDRLRTQGEWLRDTAGVRLPPSLPAEAAPYRLYVGLYDPGTLQRVPLLNDKSGENAVVIELPSAFK